MNEWNTNMSDDVRVQELLDELFDREATPEEVCVGCPDLLPVVRRRWWQICRARGELDALLPIWPDGAPPESNEETHLPEVPGYEVEEMLGHGGMGVVFRARHIRLGRHVALKMMLVGSYAGPHERERFRREAEAVAALRHPNLVQVYDAGDWEGRPYYTMELIDGGSLSKRWSGTPQPSQQAAALVATLAKAVQVAHDGGIIHRDLKPANILLSLDGTPKIADFGLARRLEGEPGLTQSGMPMGTPSYMAPEQARGDSKINLAVDIYALGAILYQMLTGRPPFQGETAAATINQVITYDPVPPSRLNYKVPRDLETICIKCLQKDPSHRYDCAAALADDLKRFEEGRPIRARRMGLAARLLRWCQRNPSSAALIPTILGLVGLAIGGGFWLEWERSERRAESARRDERESQSVEAALRQASELGKRDRWLDVLPAIDGALSLLNDASSAMLRQRLLQARADASVAIKLEEIRLRLSTSPSKTRATADRLYAEAFQTYFYIDLLSLDAMSGAQRVVDSAIRETLLAYLHDWHYWASDKERSKIQDILDTADGNPWRNSWREAVALRDTSVPREIKRMVALAASEEALAQPPLILSGLSGVLLADGQRTEALALLREAHSRYPDDFWLNYLLGLFWERTRPLVAVGYFRAAAAIRPRNDEIYVKLGRTLLETTEAEEAVAAFRKAFELNPNADFARDLSRLQAPRDKLEAVRAAWERLLERDPPDHDSWYGYAELCLFLNREDDFHRARRVLLKKFGQTTNPFVAERTARACLLLPGTDDELRQTIDLAERAVAEREDHKWAHPYFEFVRGLGAYRQGRFEQAIRMMRGDAASAPGPAPRQVLVLSLYRSGQTKEACQLLGQVHSRDKHGWIYNILRREAESMILPNLHAFRLGEWKPQDNTERLALLGTCEAEELYGAASNLCAEAFEADPELAETLARQSLRAAAVESNKSNRIDLLASGIRYRAARCAALVGCGYGEDAISFSDAARAKWRRIALEWLRDDLALLSKSLSPEHLIDAGITKELLSLWQSDPDLAGIREGVAIESLPDDERLACRALWADVGNLLIRYENEL